MSSSGVVTTLYIIRNLITIVIHWESQLNQRLWSSQASCLIWDCHSALSTKALEGLLSRHSCSPPGCQDNWLVVWNTILKMARYKFTWIHTDTYHIWYYLIILRWNTYLKMIRWLSPFCTNSSVVSLMNHQSDEFLTLEDCRTSLLCSRSGVVGPTLSRFSTRVGLGHL